MPTKLAASCLLAIAMVAAVACGPDDGAGPTTLRGPARTIEHSPGPEIKANWYVEGDLPPRTRTPEIERMLMQLKSVRAACEFYRTKNRYHYPDFEAQGWEPLVESKFLRETPTNPLSPPEVASKILVVRTPNITGANVNPRNVGWVWVDRGQRGGVMFAAGFRD